MELDPALEPQTLSGALVAGEMSATTSDLTAGLVLFLVWWGANESETAPTGAHMDPHMWPEAGFERGSRQLALLDLSRGRYGAAFERLLPITRQDRIDFGILILADFIEAATRSGRPAEAKAAFERLAVRATAAAAPLGLGTLARCRAFLSDQEEAEGNYRESIMRLADANSAMELARSHLVLGEWLRRQRRRRDARLQLKIAYGMFSDFGATGFSERARIEFLATGGAARVRGVETANDLTPQETRIARLVASGETNREVAAKLFISPATVDYHLRKVFQKLDVLSRTQLARKIAVGAAPMLAPADLAHGWQNHRRISSKPSVRPTAAE